MFSISDIKTAIDKISDTVIKNKELLTELDGKSGDGDLGMSMESAFLTIKDSCRSYSGNNISEMFLNAAISCNKAAPSTMGTLLSSGLMMLAKMAVDKTELSAEDVIKIPRIFANAISQRGKAKLGDKTILDALIPYADEIERLYNDNMSLQDCFKHGSLVAKEAAMSTAGIKAKIGRAKWLGERAAQYPDAGATLCAIIADACY